MPMCTQFAPTRNDNWVREHLGLQLPGQPYPQETFPGYVAPIALLNGQRQITCTLARFGLISHWANDAQDTTRIGCKTYNARCETVPAKPSYRTAWPKRQFAIAPLDDFFEPN